MNYNELGGVKYVSCKMERCKKYKTKGDKDVYTMKLNTNK